MTVDEIIKKYASDVKDWYIPHHIKEGFDVIDGVMANLVYLGLHGNKRAESLLYSYSPHGAMSGEMHSSLLEWYELIKQWDKR